MSILSENIRYLRAQLGLSQNKVANDLIITRVRYAKYEDATSEPPVELLIRMSRYFHISGKNGQSDHLIPVQIDQQFRMKVTT